MIFALSSTHLLILQDNCFLVCPQFQNTSVGWFTTVYPVALKANKEPLCIESLEIVKKQMRNIPNNGFGYGLLRYSKGGEKLANAGSFSKAEICFNYLGQFDNAFAKSGLFRFAGNSPGNVYGRHNARPYALHIISMVAGGQLETTWHYSTKVHKSATIENLARSCEENLRGLLAMQVPSKSVLVTPSDFPDAGLSQEDLNKIFQT